MALSCHEYPLQWWHVDLGRLEGHTLNWEVKEMPDKTNPGGTLPVSRYVVDHNDWGLGTLVTISASLHNIQHIPWHTNGFMEIIEHSLSHATGRRRWRNWIRDSIEEDEDEEDKNRSVCHDLARRIHGSIPCQTSARPSARWQNYEEVVSNCKWGSACIWVWGWGESSGLRLSLKFWKLESRLKACQIIRLRPSKFGDMTQAVDQRSTQRSRRLRGLPIACTIL